MAAAAEPQFEISRTFDAPRWLVWKAFTESDRLMHWWGPKGANLRACNVDLRPGGTFLYSMARPGGEMWGKWVYAKSLLQSGWHSSIRFAMKPAKSFVRPLTRSGRSKC